MCTHKSNQIGFLVLTLIGVTIPMLMADPQKMIRTDGTKVTSPRHPSWKVEIVGLWVTLIKDPLIILLFPMFFASNWFYTWRECIVNWFGLEILRRFIFTEFNDFNAALFNARTRSLDDLVYYLAQIFGSIAIGLLLDRKTLSRRKRAFSGWTILFTMVFGVHIWAYFYQKWVYFDLTIRA